MFNWAELGWYESGWIEGTIDVPPEPEPEPFPGHHHGRWKPHKKEDFVQQNDILLTFVMTFMESEIWDL